MKVGRDEKRRQKVRRLPPSSLLLFSVSRPAGNDAPRCKQTTQIIKAPLDQRQDAKQNEMFESCRASFAFASCFWSLGSISASLIETQP